MSKAFTEKEHAEEVVQFANEYVEETDRATVILGAAKLDTILRQILLKVLVPSPSRDDELLD